MIASVIATVITEGIIFLGIYFYETEILAGEYLRIWGSTVEGHVNLDVLGASSSTGLNLFVFIAFTILLLVLYFILFSHNFVIYVREIINGVEKMKSGDFSEEIPVQGEHMKDFEKILKKYGVDFAIMKEKLDPSRFLVFFKARDEAVLTNVLKECTDRQLSKAGIKRPSVLAALKKAKELIKAIPAKTRQKEKDLSR